MSGTEFEDPRDKTTGEPLSNQHAWEIQTFKLQSTTPSNVEDYCAGEAGTWELKLSQQRYARGAKGQNSEDDRQAYIRLMVEVERLHAAFEVFDEQFPEYKPGSPDCESARNNLLPLRRLLSNLMLLEGQTQLSRNIEAGHAAPSASSINLETLVLEGFRSNPDLREKLADIIKILCKHDFIVAPQLRHDI